MEFLDKNNKFTPSLFSIEEPVKKSGARSTRALLVQDFCLELDKYIGTKYKDKHGAWRKITESDPRWIAVKLSHLNTAELYSFLSECRQQVGKRYKDADGIEKTVTFRLAFFGALKVDKSPSQI